MPDKGDDIGIPTGSPPACTRTDFEEIPMPRAQKRGLIICLAPLLFTGYPAGYLNWITEGDWTVFTVFFKRNDRPVQLKGIDFNYIGTKDRFYRIRPGQFDSFFIDGVGQVVNCFWYDFIGGYRIIFIPASTEKEQCCHHENKSDTPRSV